MTLPSLFIGSSTEGTDIAYALQTALTGKVDVRVWDQGIFGPGQSFLEDLLKASQTYDFAVMVLRADDWRLSRDEEQLVPRDNVLFELGLFMGAIGRDRTFFLYDTEAQPILPTDLAGITTLTFQETEDPSALRAAIGPAAQAILQRVGELGSNAAKWINLNPRGGTLSKIAEHSHRFIDSDDRSLRAFKRHIEQDFDDWEDEALRWGDGKFHIQNQYSTLLYEVYKYARTEIFSTSIPSYSDYWIEDSGKRILNIQKTNKSAKSTRVFILDSRSDLDEEMTELLALHHKHQIQVRVLFQEEYETQEESAVGPQDVADWTLVDEDITGVTLSFGRDLKAEWTVKDPKTNERFMKFRDRLMQFSEPFKP